MESKRLLHQWWEREYHNNNNNIYDELTIKQKLISLQYKQQEEHHHHHQQHQNNNYNRYHNHIINFNATTAPIDEHFSAIFLHRSSTSSTSTSSTSTSTSSSSTSTFPSLFLENSNLFLIISYFIVILIGILTNVLMLVTVCKTRSRNSLLIALCLADILVTAVSAPLTFVIDVTENKTSLLFSIYYCKIIKYLQILPVAASTLSLLMLSFDRYATVKHPKLAQLRQRRYLTILLPLIAWIIAMVVCSPQFLFYRILQINTTNQYSNNNQNNNNQNNNHPNYSAICTFDFGSYQRRITFILIFTTTVFLIPGFGVLLNHLGVRKRLCALSLTARAAHGELPLPMPILRRPTHMIIVTGGIPNTGLNNNNKAHNYNEDDDGDDDDDGNHCRCDAKRVYNNVADCDCKGERNNNNNNIDGKLFGTLKTKVKSKESNNLGIPNRVARSEMHRQRIQYKNKKGITKNDYNRSKSTGGAALPLPQTTTLRARRRLANLLVMAALIFIICWSPYVFCFLSQEISEKQICSNIILDYTLLLGYAHSAVSPILYWILNHSSIRQTTTCVPILRLTSVQKYLRTYLRAQSPPAPPSSTNEAALGPFNPRFIKTRPKHPEYHVPAASSHYLY